MRLKALATVMMMVLGLALSAQAETIDSGGTFFTGGSIVTMVNFQPTIELIEYQPVFFEPTQLEETTFTTYSSIWTLVHFQPIFELIPYVPMDFFITGNGNIFQTPMTLAVVPVPASVLLFGPGLLALALWRRNNS